MATIELLCFGVGPMAILGGAEVGVDGVLGDVVLEPAELGFVADVVVEGVLLPEAALGLYALVDLGGAVVLPRFALGEH